MQRLDSKVTGTFSFKLNFYNKEIDKKKSKQIQFDCRDDLEEHKGATKKSCLTIAGISTDKLNQSPREFDVNYVIER